MLLTRPPLVGTKVIPKESQRSVTVRLACVRPTASVQSEPGSNSPVQDFFPDNSTGGSCYSGVRRIHRNEYSTQLLLSELDAKAPTQSACKLLKIKAHPRKELPEEVRIIQISYRLSNLFWCFLHLFQQARFNHCQPQPTSLKKHS